MSTEVTVSVLTALAAVVVVLTRVRLGRRTGGGGQLHTGRRLLDVHTGAGGLAVVLWTVFLVGDEDSAAGSAVVGIAAIALWWVTAAVGLLLMVRWLPSRGRHASAGRTDSWSGGPALSILAHLGMVVAVAVFTWAYLTSAV